jgi:hypothetical protein
MICPDPDNKRGTPHIAAGHIFHRRSRQRDEEPQREKHVTIKKEFYEVIYRTQTQYKKTCKFFVNTVACKHFEK